MKRIMAMAMLLAMMAAGGSSAVMAGDEPYVGEIMLFAGNYETRGWALCDGRLLPISQNCALYSLIGTQFGGDGRVNFALPDLRGRVPVMPNPSIPGMSRIGQDGGSPTVALQAFTPTDVTVCSAQPADTAVVRVPSQPDVSKTVNNQSPYLCMGYYIALEGIYPPRP